MQTTLTENSVTTVAGIDLSNIAAYKKAGVCGFGIGSNITDKKLIENGEYQKIKDLAEQYVRLIKE